MGPQLFFGSGGFVVLGEVPCLLQFLRPSSLFGALAERSQNKRDTQVTLIGGKVAVGNIALRISGRTEDKRAIQSAVHRNILGFGDGQLNNLAGQPTAAPIRE